MTKPSAKTKQNTRPWQRAMTLLLFCVWAGVGLYAMTSIASAAYPGQIPIYTPTPGPDGRIIYIVQPNDTLLSISLLTGISVEELRALNNLTGDTIYPGQELLLGYAGPPEETAVLGPSPTPTELLPTPTPKPGLGNLCILLFQDINGDAVRQEEEVSIPDGLISFGNQSGEVSMTTNTVAGSEPECFNDLPEGRYTISVAIPEGYNPTTELDIEVNLGAGEEIYVNFGAQLNSQAQNEAPQIPAQGEGRSPLLGIVGGVFLVVGVLIAVFAARMMRGR